MKDLTNGMLKKELEYAKTINDNSLQECLDRLKRQEENDKDIIIELYIDFAPHSFYFVKKHKVTFFGNGGIIFHGSHDNGGNGGSPTFSVSLNNDLSPHWEIHT